MKNFELIKAGQPSEVEILSVYAMNNIIGGRRDIQCSEGFSRNSEGTSCNCGFKLTPSRELEIPTRLK